MGNAALHTPVFIDGQPYEVRLLTSDEWDRVIDTVGANNNLLHYSKTASWVQDKDDRWSDWAIVRGGQQARTKESHAKTDIGPRVGFRPCLVPLNPTTFEPDPSCFSSVKDGELLTFGTVRICDRNYRFPVPKTKRDEGDIQHNYTSPPVCISDSIDDAKYNIQWVKAGNLLIADRNLLKHVSWQDLNAWGLVFGRDKKTQSVDFLISRANAVREQSAESTSIPRKHKEGFSPER